MPLPACHLARCPVPVQSVHAVLLGAASVACPATRPGTLHPLRWLCRARDLPLDGLECRWDLAVAGQHSSRSLSGGTGDEVGPPLIKTWALGRMQNHRSQLPNFGRDLVSRPTHFDLARTLISAGSILGLLFCQFHPSVPHHPTSMPPRWGILMVAWAAIAGGCYRRDDDGMLFLRRMCQGMRICRRSILSSVRSTKLYRFSVTFMMAATRLCPHSVWWHGIIVRGCAKR